LRKNLGRCGKLSSDQNQVSPLPGWIREWFIGKWNFHPALLNGKPTQSEMNVLLQFYFERTPASAFPENQPSPTPVTLIRIVPGGHDPSRWEVHYGFMQEFETMK